MNKQPLLLLHGALGSAAQFTELKAALYNSDYDVHAINFSGHGGKPFNRFSMDQFVREVALYIGTKKLEQVNVLGYSMGGYIALEVARQLPHFFHQIVTLATKFDWSPDVAAKETQRLLPEQIEAKVPQFAAQLEKRHAPVNWKMVVRKTALLLMDLGEHPLLTADRLQEISVPVSICRGSEDRMVSAEESQWAADLVPKGQYVELAGVPHPLEKVPTETLLQLVKEHLS
jgi:pimeloyl-ACP methyl ester carboxylesterase